MFQSNTFKGKIDWNPAFEKGTGFAMNYKYYNLQLPVMAV